MIGALLKAGADPNVKNNNCGVELLVGGVEAVGGLEAVEPLQGGRRRGVPRGDRRVELADAVPLLGDETEVHRPPAALEDRLEAVAGFGCAGRTRIPTIPKPAKF